jgi:hypothetical protein
LVTRQGRGLSGVRGEPGPRSPTDSGRPSTPRWDGDRVWRCAPAGGEPSRRCSNASFTSTTSHQRNAPHGRGRRRVRWRSCTRVPPISTGMSTTTPLTAVSDAPVPRNVCDRPGYAWPGRFVREPSALAVMDSADGEKARRATRDLPGSRRRAGGRNGCHPRREMPSGERETHPSDGSPGRSRELGGYLGNTFLMFARQRLHPAEVWKRQSPGKPDVLPDRRLARPTGPEARYEQRGCHRVHECLRSRWYRIRPTRVTMYRWEGIRLPYALLYRGISTKYTGWSARPLNGCGRARTPISGRSPGRTGPDRSSA